MCMNFYLLERDWEQEAQGLLKAGKARVKLCFNHLNHFSVLFSSLDTSMHFGYSIFFGLTYFFISGRPYFVKNPYYNQEGDVKFDTLHPTRFVWIHAYAPFVKLHLLRFNIKDFSCWIKLQKHYKILFWMSHKNCWFIVDLAGNVFTRKLGKRIPHREAKWNLARYSNPKFPIPQNFWLNG